MVKIELTEQEQALLSELVWQVGVNGDTVKVVAGLMEKFPKPEKKDANQGERSV